MLSAWRSQQPTNADVRPETACNLCHHAGVHVALSGGIDYALTWEITYPPATSDIPQLRIVSLDITNGSTPQIAVSTLVNASSDLLIAPIPAEWLQVPAIDPWAVQLEANGIGTACDDDARAGCTFLYAMDSTPSITSVVPTEFNATQIDQVSLIVVCVCVYVQQRLPGGLRVLHFSTSTRFDC
jgi:hypothetical protein